MSTMHRATITRVTADGVYVEIPALGNGVEYGPLAAPSGLADFQFFTVTDTDTVDLTLSGAGFPKVLSAEVLPNSIALADLAGVDDALAPGIGDVLAWDGTSWVASAAGGSGASILDDLTDVVVGSPAEGHVLQHNGSAWVNSATLDMIGAASGTDVLTVKVAGDTQKRAIVNGSGAVEWGSGSGAVDTTLERTGAGVLRVTSTLNATTGLQINGVSVIDLIYPVGAIFLTTTSTNPGTYLGGTWVALQDRILIGAGGTYAVNATGGAATATLTTTELPAHTHGAGTLATSNPGNHTHDVPNVISPSGSGSGAYFESWPGGSGSRTHTTTGGGGHTHTMSGSTASEGSGSAFSIMNPYLAVYMWRRTA